VRNKQNAAKVLLEVSLHHNKKYLPNMKLKRAARAMQSHRYGNSVTPARHRYQKWSAYKRTLAVGGK